MWDFIFGTIWGWVGTAGIVVIACIVVGYFVPGLRLIALEVAGVVISAATIYAKGNRDEAAKWNKAIERDVQKGQKARADADSAVDSGRVRGTEWDRDSRGM